MTKIKQLSTFAIDDKDKKILQALQENAKSSYRQIAKKILVSVATVMHRVNKLEAAGIIRKYTVQLDYEKLGYDISAVIEVRVAKAKFFEVAGHISRHPNVQAVYDVTGPFDALVLAKFMNRRDLDKFVKKVQSYDFVERTETKIVLNTTKEEFVEL